MMDTSDHPPEVSLRRDELAEFLIRNRSRVLRRARHTLGQVGMLSDDEDVCSSVYRRIDKLFVERGLRVGTEEELWAIILVVTDRVALTKARLAGRIREWSGDVDVASLIDRADSCADDHASAMLAYRMLMSLDKAEDRELVLMRLRGDTFAAIANLRRQSERTVRRHWSRICRELYERFHDERPSDE